MSEIATSYLLSRDIGKGQVEVRVITRAEVYGKAVSLTRVESSKRRIDIYRGGSGMDCINVTDHQFVAANRYGVGPAGHTIDRGPVSIARTSGVSWPVI
ncbi:hypothetical protein MSHO_58640 [Mycobacterium shottsii]|uniref:Uncharacterized protein n=1 Tax=Mycobacterium shottsii TaxID=133549 RepID=A0A7I7LMI7_9MYCO|nr:hypothetical protein MSHO_58640 [Mycobacterium shottsii]